jgi:hypothetical protein
MSSVMAKGHCDLGKSVSRTVLWLCSEESYTTESFQMTHCSPSQGAVKIVLLITSSLSSFHVPF